MNPTGPVHILPSAPSVHCSWFHSEKAIISFSYSPSPTPKTALCLKIFITVIPPPLVYVVQKEQKSNCIFLTLQFKFESVMLNAFYMKDENWKTILFSICPKRKKKNRIFKYGQTKSSILINSCTLGSALRFVCEFSNFHLIIFRSQAMWGVVRVQD